MSNGSTSSAVSKVTSAIICRDPAHLYELTGGNRVQFIKRSKGELVVEGTTNEELLQVLIHRTKILDSQFPCHENKQALVKMEEALMWFNERTAKRTAQGVETLDMSHADKPHA